MIVVISQPMLFPWPGLIEQILAADSYVDYADVQFSKGSLVNRVQIKTQRGTQWLSVPLHDLHLGQHINNVRINESRDWRRQHCQRFAEAYASAPFLDDALAIMTSTYRRPHADIGALALDSMLAVCRYFGIGLDGKLVSSAELAIAGSGSPRVLDIVRSLGGDTYLTGHGASRYLDHLAFEHAGIKVEYMAYAKTPYPQQHGDFNPYVSSLDLIANTGPSGVRYLCPTHISWREFLGR